MKARLALALLIYTGARRSDMILLGCQHVKDGWLRFTVRKTRHVKASALEIPVPPELRAIIDASPVGDLTFLVTQRSQRPTLVIGFATDVKKRGCHSARHMACGRLALSLLLKWSDRSSTHGHIWMEIREAGDSLHAVRRSAALGWRASRTERGQLVPHFS